MRVAFLDRDGLINEDTGYLYKWEDFEYKTLVKSALLKLRKSGFQLIVVTNQSGISRGFYSERDFEMLTLIMKKDLEKSGISLLDVFYCPHHVEGKVQKFAFACDCRKPKPGLFFQAFERYAIDKNMSVMFGDKYSDLEAAQAAGIPNRYLVTDNLETDPKLKHFDNLKVAVQSFLIYTKNIQNV